MTCFAHGGGAPMSSLAVRSYSAALAWYSFAMHHNSPATSGVFESQACRAHIRASSTKFSYVRIVRSPHANVGASRLRNSLLGNSTRRATDRNWRLTSDLHLGRPLEDCSVFKFK